jgi:hypothetical protein
VPGGVAEALHLLVLRAQVADAVVHDVHEREPAGNGRGRHVPDDDRQLVRGDLPSQPVDHRPRQLDPGHGDTPGCERDGDPTGADRELQRGAGARQSGEEAHGGIEHLGCEHVGRVVVVPLGRALVPQIAARHEREPARRRVLAPRIYPSH